jgi:hypothetical protein
MSSVIASRPTPANLFFPQAQTDRKIRERSQISGSKTESEIEISSLILDWSFAITDLHRSQTVRAQTVRE